MDLHRRHFTAQMAHGRTYATWVLILLIALASFTVPTLLAGNSASSNTQPAPSSASASLSPICTQLLVDPSFEARNNAAWKRPVTAYQAQYV